jgi:hydrogenase-4 membrane subunit HyfE
VTPEALFLFTVLVPVFFASPRATPTWVALQGLALGWSVASRHGLYSMHSVLAALEIVVVRAGVAPWLLSRAFRLDGAGGRLLPSNLFTWILAVALSFLAFEFAGAAGQGTSGAALGSVCVAAILALLVLSSNGAGTAQLFAFALLENSILLFESSLPELWSLPVHAALASIYVLTLAAGVRFVTQLRREAEDEALGELS